MDELASGFELGLGLDQAEGDRLVVDDRAAESDPFPSIGDRVLEGGARDANGLRADADTSRLQGRERDPVPFALAADEVLRRHAHALENQRAGVRGVLAELVLNARNPVARRVGRHGEARDSLLAGGRVGDGEQEAHPRDRAAADELLAAVDDPSVALAHRTRAQIRGIRPGLRFGEREARNPLARRHRSQQALLLRPGAVSFQDGACRRVVNGDEGGDRGVPGGDLLQRHGVGQGVQPGPAPLGRGRGAEEAEGGEFADNLRLNSPFALAQRGPRGEFLLCEGARRGDNKALRGQGFRVGDIEHGRFLPGAGFTRKRARAPPPQSR